MKITNLLFSLTFLAPSFGVAWAIPSANAMRVKPKPLALIYKGPGSCSREEGDAGESGFGCSEAAAQVAKRAGFQVRFVGPTESQISFRSAKLWIQPGGISVTAAQAMSPELKKELIQFVGQGGGYVGFCAGAFLATSMIGDTDKKGLGIFPGSTQLLDYENENEEVDYAFLKLSWSGHKRAVFFEGGPYLAHLGKRAQVIATYPDGKIAAARAKFGKGRVFITGPHPEAPRIWSKEDGVTDPDGSDLDLAVQMVRWAAHSK